MCNGGECRWEANFRKTHLITTSSLFNTNHNTVLSSNKNSKKPASGGGGSKKAKAGEEAAKRIWEMEAEKKRCAREAERAEKLMHLICWGPI